MQETNATETNATETNATEMNAGEMNTREMDTADTKLTDTRLEEDEEVSTKMLKKEEIMTAIKDCAARLGRTPSFEEVIRAANVSRRNIIRRFGTYRDALRECGLNCAGRGYRAGMQQLFEDYAAKVRRLGGVPSVAAYELDSKYTSRPLTGRFRTWKRVPVAMLRYAEENGLESQWPDVTEILRRHCGIVNEPTVSVLEAGTSLRKKRLAVKGRLRGAPLFPTPMVFAPVNEQGVVYLFGTLSERLGFMVTWIGPEFPDCDAYREVEPGRWKYVLIEFEYESKNFLRHGHNPDECDLIVCWEHNWEECPIEVVDLKEALKAVIKARNLPLIIPDRVIADPGYLGG